MMKSHPVLKRSLLSGRRCWERLRGQRSKWTWRLYTLLWHRVKSIYTNASSKNPSSCWQLLAEIHTPGKKCNKTYVDILLAVTQPNYRDTVKVFSVLSYRLLICIYLRRPDLHHTANMTLECQKTAVRAGFYVTLLSSHDLLTGVPKQHRGEVWKFLSEQHLLRQMVSSQPPANHTPYRELLKQVSSEQHAILIDLGKPDPPSNVYRTFFPQACGANTPPMQLPTHPCTEHWTLTLK